MPISSTFDKDNGTVIYTITGEIQFEEIKSTFENSLKHHYLEAELPVLWDFRNANLLKANEEDFIKVSNYYKGKLDNRTNLKGAFVVSDDINFEILKLFEAYAVEMPVIIKIFKSFKDAKNWLRN